MPRPVSMPSSRDPELNRPTMSRRYRLKHKDGHWENFEAQLIRITNRSKDLVRVIGMQVPPGTPGGLERRTGRRALGRGS